MNLISNIFEIFKELLPDKRDPILVWATKVIIGIMFIVISFTAIRDSPIGVSWGINSPPKVPALTNKEYRDINAVLYTFLIRVREENPDTRGVYFVVAFYKNGNINFADENFDRIGVFTWYSQNSTYISFQTFEEVFVRETRDELIEVSKTKICKTGVIDSLGIERYKQALPAFSSNRYALCPVPNMDKNRLPYGVIISYWINDPKKPQVENKIVHSLNLAAENMSAYIKSRNDLEVNKN